MRCRRLRGRCLWTAALAAPLVCWGLVLGLAPTGWAKARLAARLEAATGRVVRIDSIRLGLCGNLRLEGLSFAESATPSNPYLRIRSASIDVHLGQILIGRCQPGDVAVSGASVRIWRRADGTFEFGDLARSTPAPHAGRANDPRADLFPTINVVLDDATVHYVDDTNGLRLNMVDVSGRGSFGRLAVQVDDLRGLLNGGPIRVAAHLDRDPTTPRFAAEVQAQHVRLDRGLEVVEQFVPLVARDDHAIGGLINVRLALKARGDSAAEIRRTATGQGSILLDPIDLDRSRILDELRTLGDCPKTNHVAAVSSNFVVADGRITTDDLTIRGSKIPFVVAGWTDFDGRFDYRTQVDRMIANLPREARSLLGELKINFDQLAGLRIEGQPGTVRLTLDGRPLAAGPGQPTPERVRFRQAARQLRDRFF